MTVYFIKCKIPSITYLRGIVINNDPVNLALCKQILKGTYSWYPDNTGLPAIYFDREQKIAWVYRNATDRDEDFEKISGIQT